MAIWTLTGKGKAYAYCRQHNPCDVESDAFGDWESGFLMVVLKDQISPDPRDWSWSAAALQGYAEGLEWVKKNEPS